MLDAVRAGVPITQACLHAGIAPSAHFRAMQAGEDAAELHEARARAEQAGEGGGEDPGPPLPPLSARQHAYREYREEILRARAAVAVTHVALVGKAARGGALVKEETTRDADGTVRTTREYARPEWKASQFLLATSFREDFGASRKVEHTGADGGPIEHRSAGDEALHAIAERLAAVAAEQAEQAPGGWQHGPRELPAGAVDAEVVEDVTEDRP